MNMNQEKKYSKKRSCFARKKTYIKRKKASQDGSFCASATKTQFAESSFDTWSQLSMQGAVEIEHWPSLKKQHRPIREHFRRSVFSVKISTSSSFLPSFLLFHSSLPSHHLSTEATMLDRLANFPHIVHAIMETFHFSDLRNCALVNHAWNDAISLVLYLDVLTYRNINTTVWGVRPNTVSRLSTPTGLHALRKNAHHVRAITCKGPDCFQGILEAGIYNLLEINFVSRMQDQVLEFELLTRAVSQNSDLCAVSIEDLIVRSDVQFGQLKTFVEFLEDYPLITCFYLEAVWRESIDRKQEILKKETWYARKG